MRSREAVPHNDARERLEVLERLSRGLEVRPHGAHGHARRRSRTRRGERVRSARRGSLEQFAGSPRTARAAPAQQRSGEPSAGSRCPRYRSAAPARCFGESSAGKQPRSCSRAASGWLGEPRRSALAGSVLRAAREVRRACRGRGESRAKPARTGQVEFSLSTLLGSVGHAPGNVGPSAGVRFRGTLILAALHRSVQRYAATHPCAQLKAVLQ